VVILLSCTIEYCIDDVVKACLEILDYDEAIQTYATATISDCVSRNTRQKIHDWEEIQDEILGELQAVGESWGLDIISIGRNQFAKHKVFRVIQG
jgi:hypothetical protein